MFARFFVLHFCVIILIMKDDKVLMAQIKDKIEQCSSGYMLTSTGFLDMHQRRVAGDMLRSGKVCPADVKALFYGGYEDAERCIAVFLPDYLVEENGEASPEALEELLKVIRVKSAAGGRKLTHRDYLGSILALGITRDMVGDILVRDGHKDGRPGADIVVLSHIADFIDTNYDKAGRTSLSVEILSIGELNLGEVNIVEKRDTVASLRLDSVVASAFGLSRAKACEAIRRGIVSVNSVEALKVDMVVRECDKIVLRGRGKAVLAQVGGNSRKDRVIIKLNLYK